MKVLLIDNFHYRRGGAEVVYLNTGDMLKLHGHSVIYFSQAWKQNLPCLSEDYFPKGIDSNSEHSFLRRIQGIANYFYNIDASRRLEKFIENEKPDIAHIHLFWGGLSPSILKVLKKKHIPIVHTAHDYRMVCPGYTFKDGKGSICEVCRAGHFMSCITRRCAKGNFLMSVIMTAEMYFRNHFFHPAKYISSFIFVSKFSLQKHIQHDKRFAETNNIVMYNFSNEDVAAKARSVVSDTYKNYYLFYGRLSFEKGISTLIDAFSENRNIHLKIVGTGPLEKQLKSKCNKFRLDNIEFVGYKTGKDLYDIVKNAKYVCVASECYENNPMTIVESYTLSTPVIGASIGGITEIVNDGISGFLFESGNVNSLSKVIKKAENLGRTDYQTMKNAAKQFADTYFNPDNYYNVLIDLYSKTLSGNK